MEEKKIIAKKLHVGKCLLGIVDCIICVLRWPSQSWYACFQHFPSGRLTIKGGKIGGGEAAIEKGCVCVKNPCTNR